MSVWTVRFLLVAAGGIWGFSIVAEDALGHRRIWGELYDSAEAAEAAYVSYAPPVALWQEIPPAYSSAAYNEVYGSF